MSDLLQKLWNLKIIGIKEELSAASVGDFLNSIPLAFITYFNPETLKTSHKVNYNDCQPTGQSASNGRYNSTEPVTFSLTFTIDGTGVSGIPPIPLFVTEQVALFNKVTMEIDGKIHRPNKLYISWGTFLRTCNLVSSEITYSLFSPEGVPLRASITATFRECIDSTLNSIANMFSSPDLTHLKKVEEGDSLPLLVFNEYKNQDYYLQVAKANKLNNFRKLETGTTILLPPTL